MHACLSGSFSQLCKFMFVYVFEYVFMTLSVRQLLPVPPPPPSAELNSVQPCLCICLCICRVTRVRPDIFPYQSAIIFVLSVGVGFSGRSSFLVRLSLCSHHTSTINSCPQ